MTELFIGVLIAVTIAVAAFVIITLVELRKTIKKTNSILDTVNERLGPTLHELEGTLRSLNAITTDVEEITKNAKSLGGTLDDMARSVRRISAVVDFFPSIIRGAVSAVSEGLSVLIGRLLGKAWK